jgi:hypothetical protein
MPWRRHKFDKVYVEIKIRLITHKKHTADKLKHGHHEVYPAKKFLSGI